MEACSVATRAWRGGWRQRPRLSVPRRHPQLLARSGGDNAGSSIRTGEEEKKEEDQEQPDAIIVVAGGILEDGDVPPWVKARLDLTAELSRRHPQAMVLCSGGGTPHRPPLIRQGRVIYESHACAHYLVSAQSVSPDAIVKEWSSYDTIGNAYFSLTQHVVPRGWSKVVVVTNEFHLPRTRAAFEWVWEMDDLPTRSANTQFRILKSLGAQDEGMSLPVRDARLQRERESLASLEEKRSRITTLEQFQNFLFMEHRLYSVRYQSQGTDQLSDLSPTVRDSY